VNRTQIRELINSGKNARKSLGKGLYIYTRSGRGQFYTRVQINGAEERVYFGYFDEMQREAAHDTASEVRRLLKLGFSAETVRRAIIRMNNADQLRAIVEGVVDTSGDAMTFALAAVDWIDEYIETDTRPDTLAKRLKDINRRLDIHILPVLGNRPLTAIKRVEIIDMLKPLWREKKAECEKVLQVLGNVFKRAENRELIVVSPNPSYGEMPSSQHLEEPNPALRYEDAPKFYKWLCNDETLNPVARNCVRVQMITGMRIGEVRKTPWAEVNLDDTIWRIPPTRMLKGKIEQFIPLIEPLREIIKEMKTLTHNREFVFTNNNGKYLDENVCNKLVKSNDFLPYDITSHGMRATQTTWQEVENNRPEYLTDAMRGNAPKGNRGPYQRHQNHLKLRTEMMREYYDYLTSEI
jgi:integrase